MQQRTMVRRNVSEEALLLPVTSATDDHTNGGRMTTIPLTTTSTTTTPAVTRRKPTTSMIDGNNSIWHRMMMMGNGGDTRRLVQHQRRSNTSETQRRLSVLILMVGLILLPTIWMVFTTLFTSTFHHDDVHGDSKRIPIPGVDVPPINNNNNHRTQNVPVPNNNVVVEDITQRQQQQQRRDTSHDSRTKDQRTDGIVPPNIPAGLDTMLQRALQHTEYCTELQQKDTSFTGFDTRKILPFHNDTVVSLPSFGIVNAIQSYYANSTTPTTTSEADASWPKCQLPPHEECSETQLSVIFMAYNPDRLKIMMKEIQRMFNPAIFHNLIYEVILVWNGERHINESKEGISLLQYVQDHPVRIVYPLQMGFPNDLMNRYHPRIVVPNTKALLYYDDDGPFYSYDAIRGGFELWKRHSHAQIGAMSRQITYSPRQAQQHLDVLGRDEHSNQSPSARHNIIKAQPDDTQFISHCTNVNDTVDYQFRFFANYDANMVLPSGSMLHANYLCYLWHPVFAELRQFVLDHPVRPDDMTVSLLVSQLAGVAPRVYSRRLDPDDTASSKAVKHRRLTTTTTTSLLSETSSSAMSPPQQQQGVDANDEQNQPPDGHRSLMFSICWDCGAGMTEMKQYWAELRTEAVNAIVRYFGSLNSGSIGWCPTNSQYYHPNKDGRCDPVMAKQGWLPWMNSDGTPKETCP